MSRLHDAWPTLKHGGMLVSQARLGDLDTGPLPPLGDWLVERLRQGVVRALDAGAESERRERTADLLDTVFVRVLGLSEGSWRKGPQVGAEWSRKGAAGETLRPSRVWLGATGAELPVFLTDGGGRLGIGNSRRDIARTLEWLRRSSKPLAVVTNGRQWRLVYAGADYDAFCEWDVELWFQEGRPGPQVDALRYLLSEVALTPPQGHEPCRLLRAIQDSRKGQSELSADLGERVRQAVERLITAYAEPLSALDAAGSARREDIYRAAVRMVMRCVVVLFAEARNLLPRDNAMYHGAYGLQGLREQLLKSAGGRSKERLRHSHQAWARIVALMRLVYDGSGHQAMLVPRYGGNLFAPGRADADDAILRAVAVFEDLELGPHDAEVHAILELLTLTWARVREGSAWRRVRAPVDFSDLSSEYIGILYEGLLDFELKRADELTLFLGVGNQPALPFSRLDAMTEAQLKDLFGKLKKAAKAKADEGEADETEEDGEDQETADADEEGAEAADDAPVEPEPEPEEIVIDEARRDRLLVEEWSRKAVIAAGLMRPHRRNWNARHAEEYEREQKYERELKAAGNLLVLRTVRQGEWFLVRWGGTRKGAGTFYTRPQLAGPTVRRTLQPLAYEAVGATADPDTGLETVQEWRPRTPEAILALQVCDPAMGSGSFLVSALRYLTDALWESLYAHHRLQRDGDQTVARMADGQPLTHESQQKVPLPPDHPDLDARLRVLLKRHVVERCLYGVDIDPLAVELGKLSLWVETMDRDLPFGFLDHKLRAGNSLVGGWFDRFRTYPLAAWEREGGDKSHGTAVHHAEGSWTKAIAKRKKAVGKENQRQLPMFGGRTTPEAVHERAAAALAAVHELPVHEVEERARKFRELQRDPDFLALKDAFDLWCALWFWPAERIELAPSPAELLAPTQEQKAVARKVAAEMRFLHWELAFPDVFDRPGAGFDAVVGNPPWEIQKPNSKEFFSNLDPLYRTYGKQEALACQKGYFEQEARHEGDWLRYNARLKALGNWVGKVGDGKGQGAGYSDAAHPFRHQGSADLNTYKLFLELAHALLRQGGEFGLIVPSGLYSDKGSTALRTLLLDHCNWRWLFGFENRDKIFDIHRSFKFCPVLVRKGGQTRALRAAFMRRSLDDWDMAESSAFPMQADDISMLSPKSRAMLEATQETALKSLVRISKANLRLGERNDVRYVHHEFFATADARHFVPISSAIANGYLPDSCEIWRGPDGGLVPIVEGRMLDMLQPNAMGWVSGRGRTAVWRELGASATHLEPQFLIAEKRCLAPDSLVVQGWKSSIMDVTAATNARTVISTPTRGLASVDTVRHLEVGGEFHDAALLSAMAASYTFDWLARFRVGGLHVTWFQLEDIPVPCKVAEATARLVVKAVRALACTHSRFAPEWRDTGDQPVNRRAWRHHWAITPHERLRLRCILDAAVASLYGLSIPDFAWILRDCDHPTAQVCSKPFARTLDPKGFWRVDKTQPPELRHTVLSLVAFHDLQRIGLDAFLAQHDGDGWLLPDTLRLSDYGLGHDDRAQQPQPVASALGPRFLDWQLNEDVEASWEECRRHAALIDRILGVGRNSEGDAPLPAERKSASVGAAPRDHPRRPAQTDLFGERAEVDLFGEPVDRSARRRR